METEASKLGSLDAAQLAQARAKMQCLPPTDTFESLQNVVLMLARVLDTKDRDRILAYQEASSC